MQIYNTLTRSKEEFQPLGDPVKMYVCGITPYSASHVGHAMSYITFDVVRRYLEWRGYNVLHIQNFTDVDDKIIDRSATLGASPKDLAESLIQDYFDEMDALNVTRAHIYPRATEEIAKILEMTVGLVENGTAYAVDGDVYYRISSYADYGKLSHRTLEGMMSGARIEVDNRKEHPMDFALWKAAKPGEPSWESPWGQGRPGWHMECSAMSLRYLGERFDIHGGGLDLIFPHHENEIAQTEAFTGVSPSVQYWMHNGLLQLDDEKMSKSLGNLVTVKEVLENHSADALRLFFLGSHYRSPLSFSERGLEAMERGAARLRNAAQQDGKNEGAGSTVSTDGYRGRFIEAMDDDFGTAQAVAALYDLARDINRGADSGSNVAEAVALLEELSGVLGLTLEEKGGESGVDVGALAELVKSVAAQLEAAGQPETATGLSAAVSADGSGADDYVGALIDARQKLRKSREFVMADGIRDSLSERGVSLKDSPTGTTWEIG